MEEREEGEITEAELSDISSGEEELLRQRLQVLESYNHVLERKEAKRRRSVVPRAPERDRRKPRALGNKRNDIYDVLLPDLSDISESDLENNLNLNVPNKKQSIAAVKKTKLLKSTKKRNEARKTVIQKNKNVKLIKSHVLKKATIKTPKLKVHKEKRKKHEEHKTLVESSDETDYEYRNKRRKLQHSVQIFNHKADSTSTLKMRLMNMFSDKTNSLPDALNYLPYEEKEQVICEKSEEHSSIADCTVELVDGNQISKCNEIEPNIESIVLSDESKNNSDIMFVEIEETEKDKLPVVETTNDKAHNSNDNASDDDIETLRQNALQTKIPKLLVVTEPDHISDSEGSDELRLICLRSTLLKKAIEMKQKKKLRKRIATMSSIEDILASKMEELSNTGSVDEHTCDDTDIESVDMEIGVSDNPDSDDIFKEDEPKIVPETELPKADEANSIEKEDRKEAIKKPVEPVSAQLKEGNREDLEEDEDLLRAKLLTSLSHNLQKLCKTDKTTVKADPVKCEQKPENVIKKPTAGKKPPPETKRFIINIGESDSCSDNETTKNLTKMHMKLSEKVDFQQRLDMFLKAAREKAEQKVVPKEIPASKSKSPEKFVPKAVNHLPKSGQLEYRRLVKRMAELERLKQSRQTVLNRTSTNTSQAKDMKITVTDNEPRTVQKVSDAAQTESKKSAQVVPDLEVQIALSRKRIAAESTKVLRLKDESNKLQQKMKMIVMELHKVRSVMQRNKRDVAAVQANLATMRNQHQLLLKRSTTQHTINNVVNANYAKPYNKPGLPAPHVHNKHAKDSFKNLNALQSVTVSVPNDLQERKNIPDNRLSVQLDLSNNRKTVTVPKAMSKESPSSIDIHNTAPKGVTTNARLVTRKTSTDNRLTDGLASEVKAIAKIPTERVNSNESNFMSQATTISRTETQSSIELDDYRSPLASMKLDVSWKGDPNGILCPYEVLGVCKDSDCRYQHPAIRQ